MPKEKKPKIESWGDYVKFAEECDRNPKFKKLLEKFIDITT